MSNYSGLSGKSGAVDPRIHRTRQALWNALVELMGERGYSAISVSDVADRAGINRATFYRHFEDKDDLFRQGCRDLFVPIATDMLGRSDEVRLDDFEKFSAYIGHLFELIGKHRALFRILMLSEGNVEALSIANDLIYDVLFRDRASKVMAARNFDQNTHERELWSRSVASMFMGLVSWWVGQGASFSAAEVASVYATIFCRGGGDFGSVTP